MKILVIPDIHLKPWIIDVAEEILKEGIADRAVCLMDIPDDWDMQFYIDKYVETYDRIIAFAKAYPDALWCYGNHDVSYLWGKLESGYSVYAEATVCLKMRQLEYVLQDSHIAFIHRVDRVLFSHGGLTSKYVKSMDEKLFRENIDAVIAAVNKSEPDDLWNDESPLWLRPQYEKCKMFRSNEYIQVVGHTPVEAIYEKDGVISTDVFSTRRDGTQIGESAMIVIESTTGEYKKVEVSENVARILGM